MISDKEQGRIYKLYTVHLRLFVHSAIDQEQLAAIIETRRDETRQEEVSHWSDTIRFVILRGCIVLIVMLCCINIVVLFVL